MIVFENCITYLQHAFYNRTPGRRRDTAKKSSSRTITEAAARSAGNMGERGIGASEDASGGRERSVRWLGASTSFRCASGTLDVWIRRNDAVTSHEWCGTVSGRDRRFGTRALSAPSSESSNDVVTTYSDGVTSSLVLAIPLPCGVCGSSHGCWGSTPRHFA